MVLNMVIILMQMMAANSGAIVCEETFIIRICHVFNWGVTNSCKMGLKSLISIRPTVSLWKQ